MKKTLLIISPFVLLGLYICFNLFSFDKNQAVIENLQLESFIGEKSSANILFILIPDQEQEYSSNRTKKEIINYLSGLKFSLSEQIKQGKISIKTGTASDLLETVSKDPNLVKIVSSPRDFIINPQLLSLLESRSIPLILYTSNLTKMCLNTNNSIHRASNIWNFGASQDQYDEIYLSYLGQKFTKLGSELDIVIYSNEVTEPRQNTASISSLIQELGMKVARIVYVDERAADLYSTLRGILQLNGKLLLGIFSTKGLDTFLPQAHKLGLSFEMGLSLLTVHSDEELLEFKESTEELITPAFYAPEIESPENKNFVNSFSKSNNSVTTNLPTTNTLRGYVFGEVVNRIVSRLGGSSNTGDFLKTLFVLDGVRIQSPAGSSMISSSGMGIIQPFYVIRKHKNKANEVIFLGDISPNPGFKCM